MRQLRLVRVIDHGSRLLLEMADGSHGTTGPQRFLLPVDAVLRAAVSEATGTAIPPGTTPAAATPPAQDDTTSPRSDVPPASLASLGPREIQVRVRAGESPESLAREHQVPLERVLRFAGAVVEERRHIAGEARRARARRISDGAEAKVVEFGEAVDARFGQHGVAPTTVDWDARRRPDGEWVVVARWSDDAEERDAHWVFHRGSRTVTPDDQAAADLLSTKPIRPAVPPTPTPPQAPALRPGVFVFPPMPDAHTGPLPKLEAAEPSAAYDLRTPARAAVAGSSAGDEDPVAVASVAAQAGAPATIEDPATLSWIPGFDDPQLPLGLGPAADASVESAGPLDGAAEDADSETQRRATRSTRAGARRSDAMDTRPSRTRVPSWDDILLGVRRKTD